jgi:SAM-dependent methyltransferase
MADVDFGKTVEDYARYRAGFPPELLDRLLKRRVLRPSADVLDVGCGTGTLALQMAQRGCHVIGIDASSEMIDRSRRAAKDERLSIDFRVGRAENTGLPNASLDAVLAGQCWHWFDRHEAAAEMLRVLRRHGRLAIVHFDWVAQCGNVAEITEALIQAWNPNWQLGGSAGVYPAWFRDLGEAGFENIESFSFDVGAPYTQEGWVGRIRASAGVAASMPVSRVEEFSAALRDRISTAFAGGSILIPHRVWAVYGQKPKGARSPEMRD